MFIQSWAERKGLKYVTYNGEIEGYFPDEGRGLVDLKNIRTVTRKTALELVGVAVGGLHEFSFVFNNSVNLETARRHRLITLKKISDFEGEYSYLKAYFDVGGEKASETLGFYREGGYTRMIGDGIEGVALFLYALKRRYLSGLNVGDDYNIFDEIWAWQPEVPRGLEEDRVVIQEIELKWAVGD
ncbi:MAG: hypothetical protein M3362_01835 [Acidobacteriota bacterium]|nr:hypothetical protein [Acidobacteriota bacterium]